MPSASAARQLTKKPSGPIDFEEFCSDYQNDEEYRGWYNDTVLQRKYRDLAGTWSAHKVVGEQLNKGLIDSKTYDKHFKMWKKKTAIAEVFLGVSGADAVEGIVEELEANGDFATALSDLLLETRDPRAVPVLRKLLKKGCYNAHSTHDHFVDFINQYSEEKLAHLHQRD